MSLYTIIAIIIVLAIVLFFLLRRKKPKTAPVEGAMEEKPMEEEGPIETGGTEEKPEL